MKGKLVLGLSDGVDSAVAAYLLLKEGWEVYGLYLDIAGERERQGAEESARKLGIPFRVQEIKPELEREVCHPFIKSYLNGLTPNPCIACNPRVKIPALLRYADEIGADRIATGHYVRRIGEALYTGQKENDQSYMLARLSIEQIRRLLLPLGDFHKSEVRALAREAGLDNAEKPDSLENCFIPKGMPYDEWIERQCKTDSTLILPEEGNVWFHGEILARHRGIHHYTVGQRWPEDRDGRRLYVSAIHAGKNTLELALWEELFTCRIRVGNLSFIGESPESPFRASIRVRHTRWEQPLCTVTIVDGTAEVVCDSPLRAPAPGQAAAFYDGDRLVGGGYLLPLSETF